MTDIELKNALKRREYEQFFLFSGEEDFLKRHYINEIRRALVQDETLAVFNHLRFEGTEVDFSALKDALETPPMMADCKLIEWHLANVNAMKDEEFERLCAFAEKVKETGGTCVVFYVDKDAFDAGRLPSAPSKRYKALSQFAAIVDFPIQTDAMLLPWIEKHFTRAGLRTEPNVPRTILSRAGNSMDSLQGEIEKLICRTLAHEKDTVTVRDVEEITTVTTTEDAFGLANALLARRGNDAYRQLNDLRRRRVEPTVLLASVAKVYSTMISICEFRDSGTMPAEIAKKMKMKEYPVSLYLRALQGRRADDLRPALAACRSLDISAKGGGIDAFVGIERLIAETCCGNA